MNTSLLTGFDLSVVDVRRIMALAARLKKKPFRRTLAGKTIGLAFEKPSARTRLSFEVGAYQLGAQCVYLAPQDIGFGIREPVKDSARIFSRYLDAVIARTFSQAAVEELAQYATIPVINGLSDRYHPCQALADVFTIAEQTTKKLSQTTVAYIGDGNNVLHSLLAIAALCGMGLMAVTPRRYAPAADVWQQAQEIARRTGARLTLGSDPQAAAAAADFIYTDVWVSMGQEEERRRRLRDFKPFQLNAELLRLARPDCKVMHCMPVHRGEEMTDAVAESPQSIIFAQAENRMHVQKALLLLLLADKSKGHPQR